MIDCLVKHFQLMFVDPDNRGKSFCYIGDIIIVVIESKHMDRLRYAVAMVIDLFR